MDIDETCTTGTTHELLVLILEVRGQGRSVMYSDITVIADVFSDVHVSQL